MMSPMVEPSCREPVALRRGRRSLPRFIEQIAIKAVYLLALAALYFALAKIYTDFLQPKFEYMHFRQNFVAMREVESLIVLCVAAAVMPAIFRKPSDLFVSLAIVFTVVPTAMMYAYGDLGSETAFVTYAGLGAIFLARLVPIAVPAWPPIDGKIPIYLLTGFSLIGVGTTAYKMGFEHFSLDLIDVYGRRAIGHGILTGISQYIVFFALKCNLLATIISFICRRWVALGVNLIAAILFFGFMGNKGPFFGILFFIILTYIARSKFVILAIILLVAVIYVIFSILFLEPEYLALAALFGQRMLILPVFINDWYLTVFQDIKLYWSDSKLSLGLLDYPLFLDPSTTVAYNWIGKTTTHANTGFVGSGYMNAGLVGILVYAVMIGLCCRVIDEFARRRDTEIFAAIICLPGFLTAITTSDLPTVLFSGGWGFTILLLAFFDPRMVTTGRKGSTALRVQAMGPIN